MHRQMKCLFILYDTFYFLSIVISHFFFQIEINIIISFDYRNEAIVQSGMTSSKNSMEMENHVYQKSRTKDEYLSYVARLILHVREMSKNFFVS